MSVATSQGSSASEARRLSSSFQLIASAALGLFIVLAVGMLPMDAVHNAAHDTRHSAAFPCH
ncbi:CbtB domain-containing protein [Marinobacterium arenosum]|uniref:CbtB domain-containing protein n=1 Tax=Marinobacterium arenosum TaxID=2862496 RepID=UPI001C94D531|nr:CbtB domain-containing protein [Marinobacterium arenosum]MBY4676043.1 CbtB-domain containing protein [Marinobacterium arenosum]